MCKKTAIFLALSFIFLAVNAGTDVLLGEWKLAALPNGSPAGGNEPSYSLSITKNDGYYIIEVKASGLELDHFAESGNMKDPEYRNGDQMQEFMRRQSEDPNRYAQAMQNNMNYQKLRIKAEQYTGKYTGSPETGTLLKVDNSAKMFYNFDDKTLFLDRMGYFTAGKEKSVIKAEGAEVKSAIKRDMGGKWKGTLTQKNSSNPGQEERLDFIATIEVSGEKFTGFIKDDNVTSRIDNGFIGSDGGAQFMRVYDGIFEDNVRYYGVFTDGGNTVIGSMQSVSDSKIGRINGTFTMSRDTAAAEEKEVIQEKETVEKKEAVEETSAASQTLAEEPKSKAKTGSLLDNMEELKISGGVRYKSECFLENPISVKVILDTIAAWTKDHDEIPGAPDYAKGTITWKQTLEDKTVISTKLTLNKIGKQHDVFFETTVKGATSLGKADVASEYESIVKVLEEEGR